MHPEAPWLAAAAVAWALLAAHHLSMHHADGTTADGWSFDPLWWAVMVVAMMVPGVAPTQRAVVFDSLWRRRHRNGAIFVAAYLAVWIAFGVALALVVAAAELLTGGTFDPGTATVTIGLVVALAWQLSGAKRRALRRCHFRRPYAPRGWKAARDLARYGASHARACVASCGAIMGVMFLAAHDFHLMVPLTAITVVERFSRVPPVRTGAAALGLLAVLNLLPFA